MNRNPFDPPIVSPPITYVTSSIGKPKKPFRSLDPIYRDGFSEWSDVESQFRISMAEPDEVLFAQYTAEGYEGSASVLYRNGDTYYYASGGHCSCYGLEDQWSPEEYTLDTLIEATQRAVEQKNAWSFLGGIAAELLPILEDRR